MDLNAFLEHWNVTENPFRAEEARHDPVFGRLGPTRAHHPDFEKILGDLNRPSTSIVFGEKGSGKTAIRMQIGERIEAHNRENPHSRVALISYDDLNPVLDELVKHFGNGDVTKEKDVVKALSRLRLVDHMDAILALAVPRLVSSLLDGDRAANALPLGERGHRASRSLMRDDKIALRILQALYDHESSAHQRAIRLRRRIHAPINTSRLLWKALAVLGWVLPAAAVAGSIFLDDQITFISQVGWLYIFLATLVLWGLVIAKLLVLDRWMILRLARRVARQLRVVSRSTESWADCLQAIHPADRDRTMIPTDETDETRYALFHAFQRILRRLGFAGMIVVMDRVDEPTVIGGDPDRMRTVIWPMLNNKFLQQEGIGFKLLLPIELRHELFRESTEFFQEARLDKQSLVERLTWSGSMLYDLCAARLAACREPGAEEVSLTDLFEPDVSRQDIVDALDQMHQPRDAFKLLYRCMQEHCSNVTDEQPSWRIPRLVLETVRKQESDRVQMFYRGIRPA